MSLIAQSSRKNPALLRRTVPADNIERSICARRPSERDMEIFDNIEGSIQTRDTYIDPASQALNILQHAPYNASVRAQDLVRWNSFGRS
jgi:hypothetical protein